jgi:hypothetical protein
LRAATFRSRRTVALISPQAFEGIAALSKNVVAYIQTVPSAKFETFETAISYLKSRGFERGADQSDWPPRLCHGLLFTLPNRYLRKQPLRRAPGFRRAFFAPYEQVFYTKIRGEINSECPA